MAAPEKEGIARKVGAPDYDSYPTSMTAVKTHAVIYVTLKCDECSTASRWLWHEIKEQESWPGGCK